MADKKDSKNYENNLTLDTSGSVLIVETIEEAAAKVLVAPTVPFEFDMHGYMTNFQKELEQKRKHFEALFHIGVRMRHRGSKIEWEIVEVLDNTDNFRIKSKVIKLKALGSGRHRSANRNDCNQFSITYVPRAIEVLFGGLSGITR